MLIAENYIECDELKSWTTEWSEKKYTRFFDGTGNSEQQRRVRNSMEDTIVNIKKLCRQLPDQFEFKSYFQLMNPIVLDCYFKQNHSAIQVANYYEEVLLPADPESFQRLFSKNNDIAKMDVKAYGNVIGQLGECSDLFHLIFSEDESQAENLPSGEHWTHKALQKSFNQQEFVSLKLWKIDELSQPIDVFIEHFLYFASNELGLHLKRVVFDRVHRAPTDSLPDTLTLSHKPLEHLPLLYFNSAAHNLPPIVLYLSYFKAIEYFCPFAKNLYAYKKLKNLWLDLPENGLNAFAQEKQQRSLSVLNSADTMALEFVLQDAIKLSEFLEFQKTAMITFATPDLIPALNLDSETAFIHSLSERLKFFTRNIQSDHWVTEEIPIALETDWLRSEIPLLKWVAARVISVWSQKLTYLSPYHSRNGV